uniref:F-box domain-containing protein n=1 Tax=Oryza punctata TaxID=4537 RepID=A0A0E0LZT6_ORYPU
MAINELPDELLESVFLRLASPICLVRAASTCRRWCSVVADAGFLRLYRARNALTVGSYVATDTGYSTNWSHPFSSCLVSSLAFMPAASSPATVTMNSDRFSLDFVPEPDNTCWVLADSHGGLLLLLPQRYYWANSSSISIAVCDPWTRRYRTVIPPLESKHVGCLNAFLLGAGGAEKKKNNHVASVSNFTVLLILYTFGSGAIMAFIFSTVAGTAAAADGDEELRLRLTRSMDLGDLIRPKGVPRSPTDGVAMQFAGRAGGSLYWGTIYGVVLALNESTGELSSLTLPKCTGDGEQPQFYRQWNLRAIGGGAGDDAGRARIVRVVDSDLQLLTPLHGGREEWALEKTLRLPELTRGLPGREDCFVETLFGAKILAVIGRSVVLTPPKEMWAFSVDLETMEVERVYDWGNKRVPKWVFPVKPPWPPALPLDATTASWTSTDVSKKA